MVSIFLAFPQALIFRRLKHPELEFYQCTTSMAVEEFSEEVFVDGEIKFIFFGFDAERIYSFYHFTFLFFVFFFPLAVLMVTYMVVIKLITRLT